MVWVGFTRILQALLLTKYYLLAPSVSVSRVPDVVVFDARSGMSSQPLARGNGKGFMVCPWTKVRCNHTECVL